MERWNAGTMFSKGFIKFLEFKTDFEKGVPSVPAFQEAKF